jgi:hypothetical protein
LRQDKNYHIKTNLEIFLAELERAYPGTPNGGLTIPGGIPGIMGATIPGMPATGGVATFGESVCDVSGPSSSLPETKSNES